MTTKVYNTEIEITHVHAASVASGQKKITVTVKYDGKQESFSSKTNNMPATDAAAELEGEEKYMALYEIIANDIEDKILDFVDDVRNNCVN